MSVPDPDLAADGLDEEKPWKKLAQLHWEGTVTTTGVKTHVIKNEIWDILENEGFPSRSLQALENLQILERYLWPGYSEASTNHHVLLVVLIVTAKCREKLPVWSMVFSAPVKVGC